MTLREQTEVALQDIRNYLAGCRQSPVDPNLILADRRDFTERIDRLEQITRQILKQDEEMQTNRGEMERAARRESEQIIGNAESRADDVYGASIIYTDNVIGNLQTIIDETNDSLNGVIRRFRKEMRRQKDQLRKNETELQAELIRMKESKKFLHLIEEINEEREEKKRRPEDAKEQERKENPAIQKEKTVLSGAGTGEKADVFINKDAAYFKWAERKGGLTDIEEPEARFADVENGTTWQMERKESGEVDLQSTKIIRPVSREQVRMEREENIPELDGMQEIQPEITQELPDEDTLMQAMLFGEMRISPEADRKETVKETLEASVRNAPVKETPVKETPMKEVPKKEEPVKEESKASAAQREVAWKKAPHEVIDDADQFEYYDDDLDEPEFFDDLDLYDDYDAEGGEDASVGRQVAGKIKDFLLGK